MATVAASKLKNVKPLTGFVSLSEVADMHQVRSESVRRWIERGYLPAYQVGPLIVCKRKDAESVRRRVQQPGGDRVSAEAKAKAQRRRRAYGQN